jgi:hypothetical protein
VRTYDVVSCPVCGVLVTFEELRFRDGFRNPVALLYDLTFRQRNWVWGRFEASSRIQGYGLKMGGIHECPPPAERRLTPELRRAYGWAWPGRPAPWPSDRPQGVEVPTVAPSAVAAVAGPSGPPVAVGRVVTAWWRLSSRLFVRHVLRAAGDDAGYAQSWRRSGWTVVQWEYDDSRLIVLCSPRRVLSIRREMGREWTETDPVSIEALDLAVRDGLRWLRGCVREGGGV